MVKIEVNPAKIVQKIIETIRTRVEISKQEKEVLTQTTFPWPYKKARELRG